MINRKSILIFITFNVLLVLLSLFIYSEDTTKSLLINSSNNNLYSNDYFKIDFKYPKDSSLIDNSKDGRLSVDLFFDYTSRFCAANKGGHFINIASFYGNLENEEMRIKEDLDNVELSIFENEDNTIFEYTYNSGDIKFFRKEIYFKHYLSGVSFYIRASFVEPLENGHCFYEARLRKTNEERAKIFRTLLNSIKLYPENSKQLNTDNWQDYEDSDVGFSFKYPTHLKLDYYAGVSVNGYDVDGMYINNYFYVSASFESNMEIDLKGYVERRFANTQAWQDGGSASDIGILEIDIDGLFGYYYIVKGKKYIYVTRDELDGYVMQINYNEGNELSHDIFNTFEFNEVGMYDFLDESNQEIDISNWELFNNEKVGYSFIYPGDIYYVNEADYTEARDDGSIVYLREKDNTDERVNSVLSLFSYTKDYPSPRGPYFGAIQGYSEEDERWSVLEKISTEIGDIIVIDGTKFNYDGPNIGPGSKYAALVNLRDNDFTGITIAPRDQKISYGVFINILRSLSYIKE